MIAKRADIQTSSDRAGENGAVYTFDVQTEHNVPANGRVRFTLPDSMSLNAAQVRANCYRLDVAATPARLECAVGADSDGRLYVDVMVRPSTFGAGGLPAGEPLRVRMGGLKNPREVGPQASIAVESFDTSERLIDVSTDAQGFTVTMKLIGRMTSVAVTPQSPVNGARTTYRFDVVPDLQVVDGDLLYITFPGQVLLPTSYYVQCRGAGVASVRSCYKTDSNTLRI